MEVLAGKQSILNAIVTDPFRKRRQQVAQLVPQIVLRIRCKIAHCTDVEAIDALDAVRRAARFQFVVRTTSIDAKTSRYLKAEDWRHLVQVLRLLMQTSQFAVAQSSTFIVKRSGPLPLGMLNVPMQVFSACQR